MKYIIKIYIFFECQFQYNGIYDIYYIKKKKSEITFKNKNNGNKDRKENEVFLIKLKIHNLRLMNEKTYIDYNILILTDLKLKYFTLNDKLYRKYEQNILYKI